MGRFGFIFDSSLCRGCNACQVACKDYKEIKQGTKLRLWYKFMTMSLPAKTNASRAKILKQVDTYLRFGY